MQSTQDICQSSSRLELIPIAIGMRLYINTGETDALEVWKQRRLLRSNDYRGDIIPGDFDVEREGLDTKRARADTALATYREYLTRVLAVSCL